MHAETYGLNMTADGNYFDITHSFKVGSSTYHVLGLRKDRPTYGNTYYIFNCENEGSQSASLPFIHCPGGSGRRSFMTGRSVTNVTNNISVGQRHGTTSMRARTASHTVMGNDVTTIKKTLTEIMKSEHQTLVASIRKEMSTETQTLLRSIEKEKVVLPQAKTAGNNEKEEILRLIEEQKSLLQNTYEKHANTIISSIELLKKIMTETLNAQHEQLKLVDQLQLTLSETVEREIEKTIVKHFESYKSTSLDVSTIEQLRTTLIETIEKRSTTMGHDTDGVSKHFLTEERQKLTDLITKQQQTYARDITTIKQLQSTLIETIEKFSTTTKSDNYDNDSLKRLFAEQRQYFSDLITKQQQTFSLDLIKETVHIALKEQSSIAVTSTTHTGMKYDSRPFKISIKTGEFAHVFAKLTVGGIECPRELHTLCQRDPFQTDVVDCFVAPPMRDGPSELIVYAKTKNETEYRAAMCIQMSYLNVAQTITFPQLYQSFKDHQCILIEPLRRFVQQNEQILIHMVIPAAQKIKIYNGDDEIVLNQDEYRNGILKKKVHVQGNLLVYGQWGRNTDSPICAFEMN
jgi:hypothetical protein